MREFSYERATSENEALRQLGLRPEATLLAGGTCLLDLMKQTVERPTHIIDLNFAPDLHEVAIRSDGTLRVGAMATLSSVARRADVKTHWPLLSEAILLGLTPQLREAATFAGNITQRPRCIYFREAGFPCNKKAPGSGCAARTGVHFSHALFGGTAAADCIAVHPSDLCVALTALNAAVEIAHVDGSHRKVPLTEFHRLPGADPTRETCLTPGDLITAIEVPAQSTPAGAYVKGPAEGFALASAAVLLTMSAAAIIDARAVLGGVAHKPWPAPGVEAALRGRSLTRATIESAGDAAVQGIATDYQTGFRPVLLRAVVIEALERAASRAGMNP